MGKRKYRSLRTWHAARRKMIGASDTPAIIGEGYSGSGAWSVWYSKVYGDELIETQDAATIKRLRRGHAAEEFILRLFEDETGIEVSPEGMTIRTHPKHKWIGATCDGMTGESGKPVECKLFSRPNAADWKDGQSPLRFQIQLQHQLQVTGADSGYLVGWDGIDLHVREYRRDDKFWEALFPKMEEFWSFVLNKQPPGGDWASISTKNVLARLHPKDDGTGVILPAQCEDIPLWMEIAKEHKQKAEDVLSALENRLRDLIGDSTYGVLPDGSAYSLKQQQRKKTVPKLSDEDRIGLLSAAINGEVLEPGWREGAEAMLNLLQESGWAPPSKFRVLRKVKSAPKDLTIVEHESYGDEDVERTIGSRVRNLTSEPLNESLKDDAVSASETPDSGAVHSDSDDHVPKEPGPPAMHAGEPTGGDSGGEPTGS